MQRSTMTRLSKARRFTLWAYGLSWALAGIYYALGGRLGGVTGTVVAILYMVRMQPRIAN